MHTFRAILALALASSVCADTHSGTKRILAVPRRILEQCTEQSIEISRQSDFMANQTARHLLWHATGLNSGNCVWRQGALDMVQTEQTVVVDDETAVGEPRLAALVLPTANMLVPFSRGAPQCTSDHDRVPAGVTLSERVVCRYTQFRSSALGLTLSLRSLIQKLQVPVVVLGIGTQVQGFLDTALPQGREDSAPVQKYRSNARLRMEWNQHSALEDLVLKWDQVDFLNTVKNHSRQNMANVAVRGDVTEQVCRNSGVTNCQSLGCPSLMLSRNTALGVLLQTKWEALRRRVSEKGGSPLRLVFGMPKHWCNELAELFVSAGRAHPDFLIVLQTESDVSSVRQLRGIGLKVRDDQVKIFTSVTEWVATLASYDLYIGARIHGGMAATAASVPAVLVATDTRIDELAKRMEIPTVREITLPKQLSLKVFLDCCVPRFNGAVFDQNRARIAKKYVHVFHALQVPLSQHVWRISQG